MAGVDPSGWRKSEKLENNKLPMVLPTCSVIEEGSSSATYAVCSEIASAVVWRWLRRLQRLNRLTISAWKGFRHWAMVFEIDLLVDEEWVLRARFLVSAAEIAPSSAEVERYACT